MNGLRRLVDQETDELMLSVLRSADDDVPGQAGRDRTMAALGLSAGAGTAIAAGAGAGAGGATTSGKLFGAKVFGTAFWKWGVTVLVIGAAIVGTGLALP